MLATHTQEYAEKYPSVHPRPGVKLRDFARARYVLTTDGLVRYRCPRTFRTIIRTYRLVLNLLPAGGHGGLRLHEDRVLVRLAASCRPQAWAGSYARLLTMGSVVFHPKSQFVQYFEPALQVRAPSRALPPV